MLVERKSSGVLIDSRLTLGRNTAAGVKARDIKKKVGVSTNAFFVLVLGAL